MLENALHRVNLALEKGKKRIGHHDVSALCSMIPEQRPDLRQQCRDLMARTPDDRQHDAQDVRDLVDAYRTPFEPDPVAAATTPKPEPAPKPTAASTANDPKDKYDQMTWKKLTAAAKEAGVTTFQRSRQDITNDLRALDAGLPTESEEPGDDPLIGPADETEEAGPPEDQEF